MAFIIAPNQGMSLNEYRQAVSRRILMEEEILPYPPEQVVKEGYITGISANTCAHSWIEYCYAH